MHDGGNPQFIGREERSSARLKTGALAFGPPEYTKAAFASGHLAQRYNIPLRSSAVTASNAPDAQAAYENQMSLWGALMGGTNLLLHGAGWLEGGLTTSAKKIHYRRGTAANVRRTVQAG
ncbi:trimethylamine methyltransferase family protein [Roseovarius sp.]|uniref:trimethylamine methyltransferase family protein n=1 Tax=Roseovarius sp. TaxID=1486281 RepID=UPI003B5B0C58